MSLSGRTRCLFSDMAGAQFSEDRTYRYRLWRRWDSGNSVCFCMLNPSTANEHELDPTLRRCVGFARQWGYAAIEVVNLFALVSADPKLLTGHPDPVGPLNDQVLSDVFGRSAMVVVGWGAFAAAKARHQAIRTLLAEGAVTPRCLGTTSSGHPRHPLYLKRDTPIVAWEVS
jgi:hypothetical protein